MSVVIGIPVLLGGAVPGALEARAEDGLTAKELIADCSAWRSAAPGSESLAAFCQGYIHGTVDTQTMQGWLREGTALFCLPSDSVATAYLRDVFLDTVARDPYLKHETARVALTVVLADTFPCESN